MNAQAIARLDGTPCASPTRHRALTHDLTAARAHDIIQARLTRQIPILADHAYQDADATIRTPYKNHTNNPTTTNSSTATTPASEPPANTSPPNSKPGTSHTGHTVQPTTSHASSQPSTHY